MSNSPEQVWSNAPNAPQIPSSLYTAEKAAFAGVLIGAISHGIMVALFFRCMSVLLWPVNPIKRGVKWALIVHAVLMFSFSITPIGIDLNYMSAMYISNREYPGSDVYPPGPIGYDDVVNTNLTFSVYSLFFPLNQWLADGLLLLRCYVIYSMNRWVMAFPCLMYLASVAMGIAYIYQGWGTRVDAVASIYFTTSYLSISLSLNVILTLMIVTRLVIHVRDVRKATGTSGGSSGLHTAAATVATMLIESYALYAATLLLYIVPWAVDHTVAFIFAKSAGPVQVIAPYLIILRVAKRRALTSDSISGTVESMHFRSQGTTDGDETIPDRDSMNLVGANVEAPSEIGAAAEDAIGEVPS